MVWLGACDLNVMIRSIIAGSQSGMSIGVGGAIVHQSDPNDEHDEILVKAQASLRAIHNTIHHCQHNNGPHCDI